MQTLYRPPSVEKEGEEEAHIPVEAAAELLDTSPKRETQSGSAKITRSRSYGNGYGCTTFDDEENNAKDVGQGQDIKKQFEVRFEGDFDPMNPKSFGKFQKWVGTRTFCVTCLDCLLHHNASRPIPLAIPTNSNATIQLIVAIVSSGSACVTCASSMYTLTYDQITTEFHISREVATLGLSLFVIGLGLGPMILGPLSEFYGRRPIYIISFGFFLIWLIPCAVAKNVGTELVSRFIDGFAGSAFLSVAGGTVGDSRSRFWSCFAL